MQLKVSSLRAALLLFLFLLGGWVADTRAQSSNGVTRAVWFNITGGAVADLTNNPAFQSTPSLEEVLTNGFETPTDIGNYYGQRLRALLVPPVSGNYYFLIASDDASQLFLSTNDAPANARLIAQVTAWTPSREYHHEAGQKSAAIPLVAGQRYYIEALMKEQDGGDNLAVTWEKPTETEPVDGAAPIPATNLFVYGIVPPIFSTQPTNVTVIEGGTTAFSVQLTSLLGASFQWLRNGTNIPGATSATYTFGPVKLSDNNNTFQCRAVNLVGSSNSFTATLTVTPDVTRPTALAAHNFGDNTLVTIIFSELLDPISAATAANYFLNNGATVQQATLLPDGLTVVLRTSPLVWGNTYTVTINNVKDLAQTPNPILPNSQRSFSLNCPPADLSQLIGTNEPAGPSSRRTPLTFSEIMYHPADRPDGRNLEFIELYNSNPWPEDLTGHRITGDVGYSFPPGIIIGARSYRVIAAQPADLQAVVGLAGMLGPLTNSTPGNSTNVLPNGGGLIRLRDELDSVLLETTYSDENPWPVAADGAGHSLVLARPSYGEGNYRAWNASDRINGSPGTNDSTSAHPWRTVMFNEVLAHTDPPQEDFLELYNYSAAAVDMSGCYLTDDPATNKFRIPNGTTIGARGYLGYTATQLGFALSSEGESIFLVSSNGDRVVAALRFDAQENGVAFGRYPDGAPTFRRLTSPTMGTANERPLLSPIVINELMYKPVTGSDLDEFVEIFNRSTNAVPLDKWRLRGGINFTFPVGTTIAPNGYLVVAADIARLLTTHPGLSPTTVLGNFSGKLGNNGDAITLDKPDDVQSTNQLGQLVTNVIHIVMDEVRYETGGRWGQWSDGGGSSLERTDPRVAGNLAPTWGDSDETAKSGWTTLEFTGTLDNGAMALADQLQLFLQGPGECLVDNVEVIPQGGGNVVINGTFDGNASGWFFQGTHEDSYWQSTGGFSGGCLHLIATGRGDTGGNRIRTVLSQTLSQNTTATLRAKVRWLKGHPEILLRLHGNWLEATGSHLTTANLGSPGLRNTRYLTNSGPAITGVRHLPVLPAAAQPVTVQAFIDDPDGLSLAVVKYRIDPAQTYVSVAMTNRGAGLYTATLPGQSPGTRIAFYIETVDAGAPNAVARFPADALARECLVGFGEPQPSGTFGDYRLWLTQTNITRWATRGKQSNRPLDATYVYAGNRVVYNAGTLYSGSPFHTPGYDSPLGNLCDYELNLPADDRVLGADDFVLATIGNLNNDASYQTERTAFWIARKMGLSYLNRRYFRMYLNGQQRAPFYEDAQQPGRDFVSQFFPDDDDGDLHKIEDWFEFDDSGDNMLGNFNATLENFTTTGGAKKTARYRWNWRPRGYGETASAFTNLFALVNAVNAAKPEPYRTHTLGLMDVDEFMGVMAMERAVGNGDSYGYNRGKNMFAYKPTAAGWRLLPWDIDFVLNNGGENVTSGLFGSNEPLMDALRAFPEFQRSYWRAFAKAVNGPMVATTLAARTDPINAALVANGLSPALQPPKDYIAQRRAYILTQLATVNASFSVNPTVTVSNGLGVIQGTAPIDMKTLVVNGQPWTVRWTTVSNWVATVPLAAGSNYFSLVGRDAAGQLLAGVSNAVSTINSTVPASPVGNVVFNEIQFNPLAGAGEFIELFNTSLTNAFDLSGWSINGLDYTFPNGARIDPRRFIVLAKNRAMFDNLYGGNVLVFDEYSGGLQSNGETLSLMSPAFSNAVDRVRYEPTAPWPLPAAGMSLQLRDPAQDNSRVGNWATALTNAPAPEWLFASATANASGARLYIYLQSAGDIYVDDVKLVAGSQPEVGVNLLANGGFEGALAGTWSVTADFAQSAVSPNFKRSGNSSLHVIATGAGSGNNDSIFQNISAGVTVGQPYTLSFWYLPTTNGGPFTVRLTGNFPEATINPAPAVVSVTTPATPGATNSTVTTVAPFPSLWLNEVQPDNSSGPLDNFGQHDPWVEIYNSGTNSINLGGYYLSDSYTNLSRWAFPSNTTLAAGSFLVVWGDGETHQTAGTNLHANFRLAPGNGQVALSQSVSNSARLLDYLAYSALAPNRSYGDIPDGQPFFRDAMFQFTPGATNSSLSAPLTVFINEWMADNTISLADPADNNFEDWFEIYNPGNQSADLGGYYLTDTLPNKTQFLIPNNGHYVIPPHGYLLVWADNETGQNSTNRADLHVNFALSKGGEAIGLFAADGTQIDAVTFGAQTSDVAQGRFPDGAAGIFSFPTPTPRAANLLSNSPPTLTPINNFELIIGQTLAFTATASDTNLPAQTLTFSLGAGAPAEAWIDPISGQFLWTPIAAPSTNVVSVVATDNGVPNLSAAQNFQVIVHPLPVISVSYQSGQLQLHWPVGTLQESDNASGPFTDVTDVSPFIPPLNAAQKFFRIRL